MFKHAGSSVPSSELVRPGQYILLPISIAAYVYSTDWYELRLIVMTVWCCLKTSSYLGHALYRDLSTRDEAGYHFNWSHPIGTTGSLSLQLLIFRLPNNNQPSLQTHLVSVHSLVPPKTTRAKVLIHNYTLMTQSRIFSFPRYHY